MTDRKESASDNTAGRKGWHLWVKSQRNQCEQAIQRADSAMVASHLLALEPPDKERKQHFINGINQERENIKAGKV